MYKGVYTLYPDEQTESTRNPKMPARYAALWPTAAVLLVGHKQKRLLHAPLRVGQRPADSHPLPSARAPAYPRMPPRRPLW